MFTLPALVLGVGIAALKVFAAGGCGRQVSTWRGVSGADQRREHDAAIAELQAEYDRLSRRVQAAYLDKLDGRIDTAFFDQMSESWRAEQDAC